MTVIAQGSTSVMAQRRRPHRITLDLDEETYRLANDLKFRDGVTTSDRIRAALRLLHEDEELSTRVTQRAREAARQRSTDT